MTTATFKTILLFSIFTCTVTLLFAQTVERVYKGYYINTSKESVSGTFPGFAQWSTNPVEVKFSASGDPKDVIISYSSKYT